MNAAEVGEEARNWKHRLWGGRADPAASKGESPLGCGGKRSPGKQSRRSWMTVGGEHEGRRNRQSLECQVGRMRTGVGRGSINITQQREVGATLRWVLNATPKDLIVISRVVLRKGCIDGQLTKRRPWPTAMLTSL